MNAFAKHCRSNLTKLMIPLFQERETISFLDFQDVVNEWISVETYCRLLAESIGLPQGFLQSIESWHQAFTQLQPAETTDKTDISERILADRFSLKCVYIYLTGLEDSCLTLSGAALDSGWQEVVDFCDRAFTSADLVMHVEEHLMVIGADSVLGDVEVISWVTVCLSAFSSTEEAESLAGGVEVEFIVDVWEAHFRSTESVADEWWAFSGSFVSCKWVIAGIFMAVCWGTLVLSSWDWEVLLTVKRWSWLVESGSFSLASWYSLESLPSSELSLLLSSEEVDSYLGDNASFSPLKYYYKVHEK